MTPLHTVTPHPSPWLRQRSQNFEKLFALLNFWFFMLLKYHFLGYFKEHNTLIGLLVVDICLTGVKASWPFLQTDDKDLTNEKVSKQFPTFSSLCECGISTWPTSQSSPHSTKLYGINHRRRGPTPYSHRITGVLVRNFEVMRHALSKWCVQTLWKRLLMNTFRNF